MKKITDKFGFSYYICETCTKKHPYERRAKQCEKEHSCPHEHSEYQLFAQEDGAISVGVLCTECDKILKITKDIDYFNITDQVLLKQIYDYIKETNSGK